MYKLVPNDPLTNQPRNVVFRTSDNTSIPFDPANTEYQKYLEWLEEGNTPEPAE